MHMMSWVVDITQNQNRWIYGHASIGNSILLMHDNGIPHTAGNVENMLEKGKIQYEMDKIK